MASGTDSDILGPVLSPNATYQERMAYRREVLKLPGPIDRWLTANSRSPRISFLHDYLMIDDMQKDYVICFVEAVYVEVCLLSYRPNISQLCGRAQLTVLVSSSLIHILYLSPHVQCPALRTVCYCTSVLEHC